MNDDIRDQLPEDLNARDFAMAYEFPDNSRRRIPAFMYAAVSAVLLVIWMSADSSTSVIVNDGALVAAVILAAAAILSFTSGWRMTVNESEALVRATANVGFVVGHASAQQVWRGLRSRPTWRIFCYSAEDPPLQRGLVLVDAVDGQVLEILVESNPDAASATGGTSSN